MQYKSKLFYDSQYSDEHYANYNTLVDHNYYKKLISFTEDNNLHDKKCLEVGCGRGLFQNLVANYIGVDLSYNVRRFLNKPFIQCSVNSLPFPDNSFDAIWSIYVLEHVPEPEKALSEFRRVLKNGGLLLLAPAWQCQPWRSEGYAVRPFNDFNLKRKLIKATIPIRDSILSRSLHIFPKRFISILKFLVTKKPLKFRYRKLKPNYEKYWMNDSDAVNSMDPYQAIIWYISRGDHCINYKSFIKQFFIRTGEIIIKVIK